MKAFKILLTGLITLAVLYAASPYWTLYQIKQAYAQNDVSGIARYIDFPQVKASLKPQIEQKISTVSGMKHLPKALQGLSSELSGAVSDYVLDAAVNEQTLMLLLQGKQLKQAIQENLKPYADHAQSLLPHTVSEPAPQEDALRVREMPKMQASAHFTAWNRFEIAVPNDAGVETRFEMQPVDFRWKMTAVQLAQP